MKEEDIKESAARFRAENGNNTITQKDMIIYIMERLDMLPCSSNRSSISKLCERTKWLKFYLAAGFTIVFAVIAYLHNLGI